MDTTYDDEKKEQIEHVENLESSPVTFENEPTPSSNGFWARNFLPRDSQRAYNLACEEFNDADGNFVVDPAEEKKLVRKIDWVVMPILLGCYMFYYVDKTTLSYAALYGIKADLKLKGTDYSTLGSIFYLGWLAWAVPGNMLIQKVQIGRYLGINVFLWGVFLAAQAATKTYHAELALRFVSGMFEAVADPCFMAVTIMWYTRREQPIRIGIWYSANGLGLSFGGLIGYGIGTINSHIANWRLEFLIVGAICAAWGATVFFALPSSPMNTAWLSPREKSLAVARLQSNQTGIESKKFKWYQIWEAFKDWKTYAFFLFAVSGNVPSSGVSNFGTLIVKGLGYSNIATTLLQIPYGAFTSLVILFCVFLNDKLRPNMRTVVMAISILPNLAGTLSLLLVPDKFKVVRLLAYYCTGISNAAFVLGLSLLGGNVSGQSKKLVTMASLGLGMCVGNIIGPYFYLTSQAPKYSLGFASMIFCNILKLVIVLFLRFMFQRANRIRDEAKARGDYDHLPPAKDWAFADKTDWENIHFRYVY